MCCKNGRVSLPPLRTLPDCLAELLDGATEDSRHFLENIRRYNNAFSMTSFGHTAVTQRGWNPSFIIQGQVHHRVGPMEPANGNERYLQVYFLDSLEDQVEARTKDVLRPHIIESLSDWLRQNNRLVKDIKTSHEKMREKDNFQTMKIVIKEDLRPAGEHRRRYNAQTAPEVAILMPDEPTQPRDIVIDYRNAGIKRINELHPSYDAMQYPLAFPFGEEGYSVYLTSALANGRQEEKKITMNQYYAFLFMTRVGNFLLKFRMLFQQILS